MIVWRRHIIILQVAALLFYTAIGQVAGAVSAAPSAMAATGVGGAATGSDALAERRSGEAVVVQAIADQENPEQMQMPRHPCCNTPAPGCIALMPTGMTQRDARSPDIYGRTVPGPYHGVVFSPPPHPPRFFS
ncbi:MAG: hypothetical protein ACOY99_08210 [Pseudomonadota bacterium]